MILYYSVKYLKKVLCSFEGEGLNVQAKHKYIKEHVMYDHYAFDYGSGQLDHHIVTI